MSMRDSCCAAGVAAGPEARGVEVWGQLGFGGGKVTQQAQRDAILAVLRRCSLFEGFDEQRLVKLAELCRPRVCGLGDVLFSEREEARDLFLVNTGRIDILISLGSGRTARVSTVIDAGVCGWSALMESQTYTASAICVEPSAVLALSAKALEAVLVGEDHLRYLVMQRLAAVISARLKETRLQLISMLYS